MKFLKSALIGLSSLLAGSAIAQAQMPVSAFADLPAFRNMQLSPDGKKFMARMFSEGKTYFVIVDTSSGGVNLLFSDEETSERSVRSPMWIRDDRVVMALAYTGQRGGVDVVETRLISMQPDGSKQKSMFGKNISRRVTDVTGNKDEYVQIQDRIISPLIGEDNRILVNYWDEVFSINTDNPGNHKLVRKSWPHINYWYATNDGYIFEGSGVDQSGSTPKPTMVLNTSSENWVERHNRAADGQTFKVVGPAANRDHFYVVSDHDGQKAAVWLYDAVGDTFISEVYRDPETDIQWAYYSDETNEIWGVYLAGGEGEPVWIGDNMAKTELAKLSATFPNKKVSIRAFNQSKSHAVVWTGDQQDPGQYFIYDINTPSLMALPLQQPALEGKELGKIFVSSYAARDGLEIPAYVTLPPGYSSLDEAKNLPFVIYPHGGPQSRDYASYDFIAQMLAAQGYGVLQTNFRGSYGYGREFMEKGKKQWGQAMQDDVTDGTNWLVEQGYADAERIAILGGSYGGYASLMGATKEPDLYQCAVGLNGVYDLNALVQVARQFVGGDYRTRYIGDFWDDKEDLEKNSPVNLVDNIGIPVLLFHGQKDRVVDVTQSRNYAKALQEAGKDVTYIELPDGSHSLTIYDNRLKFLEESAAFLDRCIGQ